MTPYKIKPWKRYPIKDDGTYAPKGTKPVFVTDTDEFTSETWKKIHVTGWVFNNTISEDAPIQKSSVLINKINGISNKINLVL